MNTYLIKSRIQPDIWETVIREYEIMEEVGSEMIRLEGGTLVGQYIASTEANTYTIIRYAGNPASLLYKLLSIGIHADVKIIELMTRPEFGLLVQEMRKV